MGSDILKPWKCKNGHTLGVVQRVEASREIGGRTVHYRTTRLLLYRQAVDLAAEAPEEVEVMASVEGTMLDVRCSCCNAVRTWYEGQARLDAFLEALSAREVPVS